MVKIRSAIMPLVLAATVFVGACSSDSSTTTGSDSSSGSSAIAAASGNITVLAAASLTEAFTNEKATLATEAPDLDITYSFGGSGALVTQVQQGAPADVIATADDASMQKLVDGGQVETPQIF